MRLNEFKSVFVRAAFRRLAFAPFSGMPILLMIGTITEYLDSHSRRVRPTYLAKMGLDDRIGFRAH